MWEHFTNKSVEIWGYSIIIYEYIYMYYISIIYISHISTDLYPMCAMVTFFYEHWITLGDWAIGLVIHQWGIHEGESRNQHLTHG